jgi:hypothetical protein
MVSPKQLYDFFFAFFSSSAAIAELGKVDCYVVGWQQLSNVFEDP